MKYRVIKPFDKYRIGDIVKNDNYYIRRKIAEGGCLVPVVEKKDSGKASENKSMNGAPENKGGKK